MAQQIERLVAKPDKDLGPTRWEERVNSHMLSPDLYSPWYI